jgi:hypothetical protein
MAALDCEKFLEGSMIHDWSKTLVKRITEAIIYVSYDEFIKYEEVRLNECYILNKG